MCSQPPHTYQRPENIIEISIFKIILQTGFGQGIVSIPLTLSWKFEFIFSRLWFAIFSLWLCLPVQHTASCVWKFIISPEFGKLIFVYFVFLHRWYLLSARCLNEMSSTDMFGILGFNKMFLEIVFLFHFVRYLIIFNSEFF